MIAIGKLVKTVGLKGEIKLYPYAPEPSCYSGCTVYLDGQPYQVERFRMQKGMAYLTLSGIDTIDQAERLLETEVFMARSDIALEEDEYLISDLIDLAVETEQGESLGRIQDVLSHSGNDVLVVRGDDEILIPMVDQFVLQIDLAERRMVVRLIEGMR